jgi:outer membrane protein
MFRKRKQIFLLMALSVILVVPATAQESKKLSLEEAVKMALEYNTSILNSQLDLKIAQKKIWETTAVGLPHVDVKSSYVFLPKVPSLPATVMNPDAPADAVIELGVKNNITTDLTVSQLIFNGAYFVGLQASKAYFNMAKQTDEKARLDVKETVVNTYHTIQLAEESRKILAQNLENVDKTLYEVTEMNKQGFLEKTDVDQLEVTANSIRNAINQIDSNLDMAYRLLKIQLGMEDSAKIELSDQVESNEELNKTSLLLIGESFGIEKNVDYKLVQSAKQLAKLDYRRELTGFLPTISGYYDHTYKLKSPFFDFSPKDVVGMSFSLPIFSSGSRLSVVAQKRLAFEKAENTRRLLSNSLDMQAKQYQNDLKLKLEKLQIQKKSKELSDDIYQRTLEKYKLGMASSMDLMTSQNQYLSNLTDYFQAIYDLQVAKSKLEKLFNMDDATGK